LVSLLAFSFSSAGAPPDAPVSLELSLLAASSPPSECSPPDDSSLLVLEVLVAVVDVEVVWTAAFSALVSVGGVISGVLLGTASDTLLPPHAVTPSASSATQAAAASPRGLKAAPCAVRRWDSR
jgi:hypothetical protein